MVKEGEVQNKAQGKGRRQFGVCEICGHRTYTKVRHVGPLNREEQRKHALLAAPDPAKEACPLSEEHLAAQAAVEAAAMLHEKALQEQLLIDNRIATARHDGLTDRAGDFHRTPEAQEILTRADALRLAANEEARSAEARLGAALVRLNVLDWEHSRRMQAWRDEQERAANEKRAAEERAARLSSRRGLLRMVLGR